MVVLEVNGEIKENNCQFQSAFPVNILKNKCKISLFFPPKRVPSLKEFLKDVPQKERKESEDIDEHERKFKNTQFDDDNAQYLDQKQLNPKPITCKTREKYSQ